MSRNSTVTVSIVRGPSQSAQWNVAATTQVSHGEDLTLDFLVKVGDAVDRAIELQQTGQPARVVVEVS